MRSVFRLILIGAMATAFSLTATQQNLHAQQLHSVPKTPAGWKKSTDRRKSATVFKKADLKTGEMLTVKFYQRKPLESKQDLEQWLTFRLATGKPPMGGKWTGPPKVTRQTGNIVDGSRAFDLDGEKHSVYGMAVCVDNVHVRFGAIISSDSRGVRKHKAESERLLAGVLAVEKAAAIKQGRGTNLELPPPTVKNLTAGGQMKTGRYVGNAVYLKDNKAGKTYELIVFENGEYELTTSGERKAKTGRLVYSHATGRLDICDDFKNSTYDHKGEYCVYGKEKSGKFVIYARDGGWQHKLVWVSQSDQQSPSEVAKVKRIAIAEAKRYKHVVEPGKGVEETDIEAIMYARETKFRSGAVQLDEAAYLLMKDGRVLDGLPTAPDSLDVAASRSREPDRWGWWKKEADGRYAFAWPYRPQDYRHPNGKQVIGVPFKAGTKLDGDFGMASSSGSITSGYSSVRFWGIKLSKNGRFLKYRRGSTQAGGVPGMEALTTAVWDDEGSVTSTLSSNVTMLSKSKKPGLATHRMGTYEFDGFRLTLTFDDGHTEQHGTFTDEATKVVWFEGSSLSKRQKKKKVSAIA